MEESTPRRAKVPVSVSGPDPKGLLRVPGKKALELILESPTPAHLVQSLAEEDLFWLVQEVGPEDALPILAVASNDQWHYLLDLELWNKDRLHTPSVNRWLALLLKADPERFPIWLLRENLDFVELHLYRNIDVRIKEEDESPSDMGDRYFTLDGVFYIRIRDHKHEETLRELLERLANHDPKTFHEVLLESAGILPAEAEEGLYRRRNIRLAEKGFLPFEEAMGIYQHLNPRTLQDKRSEIQKEGMTPDPVQPIPLSTALLIQEQDLFHRALRQVEETSSLERLQIEFAAMCNQIISADGFEVREREALASVVKKACGYLDIGLQQLDGDVPSKAARVIERYRLEQIFRVGYGAGLELKWKAERWVKESWFITQAFGPAFWGDEWEGLLEGLLKKRPLFYTSLSDGELYREFKDLSEIETCHKALDEMAVIDRLLSLVLARTPITGPTGYQPLRWMNLLLTCWARDHLGLSGDIAPLERDQLRAFFERLWEKGKGPQALDPTMGHSFVDWLVKRTGLAAQDLFDQAGTIIDGLLKELENEYGSVSIEDLDPRYVRHFLVSS
ncbi:MAG: DUF6178 family protein [Thermodesulfobacteriota bacterium]|nr:DUF6178 family protein [Thermodesulfobacteriota bacterium]